MKRQYKLTLPIAILLAVCVSVPAQAAPLLSGYGGPGQGSQAMLGSALVNGPSGGGGGSSGGGAGGGGSQAGPAYAEGSAASSSLAAGPTVSAAPQERGVTPAAHSARGHAVVVGQGGTRGPHGAGARAGAGNGSRVAPVLPAGTYTAAERGASQASGVLGLSSGQLLEALLVLGALALTGALTRRLTQGSHDQGERGQQAGVAS